MPDFNNKKGAVIVEAAMVFPLVIITVITLIFMMIYFYSQLNERVDMHIMLRAESGSICENVYYDNKVNDSFPIYMKSQQIYSNSIVDVEGNLIMRKRDKQIEARKYLIDECKYVRMTDILEEEETVDE